MRAAASARNAAAAQLLEQLVRRSSTNSTWADSLRRAGAVTAVGQRARVCEETKPAGAVGHSGVNDLKVDEIFRDFEGHQLTWSGGALHDHIAVGEMLHAGELRRHVR